MNGFDWFSAPEWILMLLALILGLSILVSKAGMRLGVPYLLLFLFLGMLFGNQGLGIEFSNAYLSQFIGVLALVMILFSGGIDSKVQYMKEVAAPGIVLSTFGVLLSTCFTGTFIYYMFQWFPIGVVLSFPESLMLGAIMSSTDSASVFSVLRGKNIRLKERLGFLLELESGSNDPMAYLLVIILMGVVNTGDFSVGNVLLTFFLQVSIGLVVGYLLGRFAVFFVNRINIGNSAFYPILLIAFGLFIYAVVTLVKGNGFLAVYVAGLVIGSYKVVHKRSSIEFLDSFVWLLQIAMFVILGLLVDPANLVKVAGVGLAIGVFLSLVARPLSVLISLAPFRGISLRGKAFVSWVGLRGAVPIVFATFPMLAGMPNANLFFNIVFFVTMISLGLQGSTVLGMAKRLNLVRGPKLKQEINLILPEEVKSAMSEITITTDLLVNGNKLMNLPLPDNTLAVLVKRGRKFFVPKGASELEVNDKLLIISDDHRGLEETYKSLGVSEYTLKKNKS